MNETVKIDLGVPKRNVLLLNCVIKHGSRAKEDGKLSGLLESIPQETLQELEDIANEYLTKAGLTELSEKLRVLGAK